MQYNVLHNTVKKMNTKSKKTSLKLNKIIYKKIAVNIIGESCGDCPVKNVVYI